MPNGSYLVITYNQKVIFLYCTKQIKNNQFNSLAPSPNFWNRMGPTATVHFAAKYLEPQLEEKVIFLPVEVTSSQDNMYDIADQLLQQAIVAFFKSPQIAEYLQR